MAEIFEFKQVIHTIFNLGTLGEKYLDLTRNEWSRNPDTDNDFDHLAVILQREFKPQESAPEIENLFQPEISKYAFFKEAKNKSIVKATEVETYVRMCDNESALPNFVKI